MTTKSSAKVLCDSVSQTGARVTTMEVVMHRFVLAEFNTHRSFSRNSASSRAIPTRKMIARVVEDPAYPLEWPKEIKGMQGGDSLSSIDVDNAYVVWAEVRNSAVCAADQLFHLGVHKSVINRLLEPFLWHTIIVTGDTAAYENFFSQRCSPLAQPEIRAAAEAMRSRRNLSVPKEVAYDDWHMPFIDEERDLNDLNALCDGVGECVKMLRRISVARCARVSYLTHDSRRDVQEDLKLYERLVRAVPPHWSPLEHVCRPRMAESFSKADKIFGGNIHGWVQMRHEVESNPLS